MGIVSCQLVCLCREPPLRNQELSGYNGTVAILWTKSSDEVSTNEQCLSCCYFFIILFSFKLQFRLPF